MLRHLVSLIVALSALTGCMTIKPASSPDDVVTILAEGDLPQVDAKTASALVAKSKIPVLILLTTKACEDCNEVQADVWRAVRSAEGQFAGALLDVDANNAFWKEHGAPSLPSTIIFEGGSAKWVATGVDPVRNMLVVLKENISGFDHGLSALRDVPAPTKAKVFLVAATADSAAFGQEIQEQLAYWRSRGLKDEEIACYWSVPHFGLYWRDRDQFKGLAGLSQRCHVADLSLIEQHLKAAMEAKPSWMYLYVTSHGLGDRQARSIVKAIKASGRKGMRHCGPIEKGHLIFDMLPGRKEAADYDVVFDRICRGVDGPTPVLTAKRLQDLLNAIPSSTSKTIVLQGCYSGSIVPKNLPSRTTVLTAANPFRSSFGCDPGSHMTVFGEEFLRALRTLKPDPESIDTWTALYDQVAQAVDQREVELGIPANERSQPMFLANP